VSSPANAVLVLKPDDLAAERSAYEQHVVVQTLRAP
jgi:hypothetical protein